MLLAAATPTPAQWQIQSAPTTADLRGIHSIGNGIAWASGSGGTVLRTSDDGAHWQLCPTPPGAENLDFRGIQAFDDKTAIVMSSGKGDLSRLYNTSDGCATWTLLFTNPDPEGLWDALFSETPDFAFLLGDPVHGSFVLYRMVDGIHWNRYRPNGLHAESTTQGALSASNSSLISRGGFALFGSGGTGGSFMYEETESIICLDNCPPQDPDSNLNGEKDTWIKKAISIGGGAGSSGVYSVNAGPSNYDTSHLGSMQQFHPLGSLGLVAVGGDFNLPEEAQNIAAFKLAGEKIWHSADTQPHGFRSAVAYDANAKTWITVGPNGTDISTDDGRNWRALRPNPALNEPADADRDWNALSLPFAVGPHGRIGKLRPDALTPLKPAAAKTSQP